LIRFWCWSGSRCVRVGVRVTAALGLAGVCALWVLLMMIMMLLLLLLL